MKRNKRLYLLIFLLIVSLSTMNIAAFAEDDDGGFTGGETTSGDTGEVVGGGDDDPGTTGDEGTENPPSPSVSGGQREPGGSVGHGPSLGSAVCEACGGEPCECECGCDTDIYDCVCNMSLKDLRKLIDKKIAIYDGFKADLLGYLTTLEEELANLEELLDVLEANEEYQDLVDKFFAALEVFDEVIDGDVYIAQMSNSTASQAAYDIAEAAYRAACDLRDAAIAARKDAVDAFPEELTNTMKGIEEAIENIYNLLDNEMLAKLAEEIPYLIEKYIDKEAVVNGKIEDANAKAWKKYWAEMRAYNKAWANWVKERNSKIAAYKRALARYEKALDEYNNVKMPEYLEKLADWKAKKAEYAAWELEKAAYEAEVAKATSGAHSTNIKYDGKTYEDNYASAGVPPGQFQPFLTPNSSYTHVDLGVTVRNLQGGNTGAEVTVTKPGIYTVYLHINNWNFDTITFYVPDDMTFPATFTFGNYSSSVVGTGNEGAINQIGRGIIYIPPPGDPPVVPDKPKKPTLPKPPKPPKIEKFKMKPPKKPKTKPLIEYDFDFDVIVVPDLPTIPYLPTLPDVRDIDPPGRPGGGTTTTTTTNTPGGGRPGGGTPTPTVNLPDPGVPLVQEPPVNIPEDETPLADLPQTGIINSLMLWMMFLGAALMLGVVAVIRKRVKNNV